MFVCIKLSDDDKVEKIFKVFRKDIVESIYKESDLIIRYEPNGLSIVKDDFGLFHLDREKFFSILLSCEMWAD